MLCFAGNTCFFNSIIQILYYTPTFVDCVALLVAEIAATARDNETLALLEVTDVQINFLLVC
jgi:Ubiquitin carboxyl-terminal hydrolase